MIRTIEIPTNGELIDIPFDSLFQYRKHVILETTDESLIQSIGKIIFHNNHIYILDKKERKIVIFDNTGRFINTFKHFGNGPGEYLSLTDLNIINDTLLLLDRIGGKLIKYNLSDSLLQTTSFTRAKGMYVLDNGNYALNMELGTAELSSKQTSFNSYAIHDGKDIIYESIPYNKHLNGHSFSNGYGGNTFYHYDDSIFTYFPYNNTIYQIDKNNGNINPYLRIKIGDTQIELDDREKVVDKLMKGGIVNTIFRFYKWGEFLFFSYFYEDGPSCNVLMKKNGSLYYKGHFSVDMNGLPINIATFETDSVNKSIISILDPSVIHEMPYNIHGNNAIFKKVLYNSQEDGNPILVFYDFKLSN